MSGAPARLAWVCLDLSRPADARGAADEALLAALEAALVASGAPAERVHSLAWSPQGLSALWRLGHGRIVLHTWPERGLATVDLWAEVAQLGGLEGALAAALAREGWQLAARLGS